MKSETTNAAKLMALLIRSIYLLSLKLANFSNSFMELYAILTPEQRSELVE